MADNLRSAAKQNDHQADPVSKEEIVLGDKATGEVDNDDDHVPNVISGLKAAINNPNTSAQAKKDAEAKLQAIE